MPDLPPPPAPPVGTTASPPPMPTPNPPAKRRGRPAFGYLIAVTVGFRLFREVLERVALSQWGILGGLAVAAAGIAFVVAWRAHQKRKAAKRGGVEHTPEIIAKQLEDSGLLPPAFAEDGTILGASILAVDQLPKILEVETQYEIFGSDAQPLGTITQIGQSRGKQVARVLTSFDQFFTHHFEIRDVAGQPVLRVTRPAKLFRSKLHVFDGNDGFLGTIRQENIFWKIHFRLVDANGNIVGRLKAKNLRAWDFHVSDAAGTEIATVVKSWEGWGRTAFTRADRYVSRVHVSGLPHGLRELVVAVPLMIDLSLKQDARGLG
jgi:uncharacterized protein YxjI